MSDLLRFSATSTGWASLTDELNEWITNERMNEQTNGMNNCIYVPALFTLKQAN